MLDAVITWVMTLSAPNRPTSSTALGQEERWSQSDDADFERMAKEIASTVPDDGQHHHQLGEEGQPDGPIEYVTDRPPRLDDVHELEHGRGNREQRCHDQRLLHPLRDRSGPAIHHHRRHR
jgi:hypothetical protein